MIELSTIEDYKKFSAVFAKLSKAEQFLVARDMCRRDLFFLMTVGLGRKDMVHPWILARCKDVQENPDGYLDLWAREHYKSTIITIGLTIQDILSSHGDEPLAKWKGIEPTIGIFSHVKSASKHFLGQIKREFESNILLKGCFPDILWDNPDKEAPTWSLDGGILVKRKSNPKEHTIEAHGIVEGQPTGRHFFLRVYDDVVTIENVRSPDMIEKTTHAWELSLNLGAEGGKVRYIGTRYHFNDTYKTIMDRKAAIPRIHAATVDGTVNGAPVLLSKESLDKKRREQGPYTFNSQQLLNPVADENQGFKRKWLQYQDVQNFHNMNIYILVDPANEKKKSSDYTSMTVVGLSGDNNFYILEFVRDRLSLTERAQELFRLHRKYQPREVGYEQYGMQADIAHIKDCSKRINYNFKIIPLGGRLSKIDRIRKLIPLFEQGRIYLPETCAKTDYEGKTRDLVEVFREEEYANFPVSLHDDMLDSLARILDNDLKLVWPKLREKPKAYAPKRAAYGSSGWGI